MSAECRYCREDAVGVDALGRPACEQHIEEVADDTRTPAAASRISQEVRDRDELGSLVAWLRGRTTYSASIPDGCGEPWLAALERILAHIDREGMHYADQHTVAEPNLPEGVLWALKSEDFMAMVNEVSLASRGLPEHLSDAEREAKKCDCGYPEKPCLRIMLRNGPPFPPRPCEPIQRPA